MARLTLYYATNRRHRGRDRWHPTGYGTDFSRDGLENLRFGVVHLEADRGRIRRELERPAAGGRGDGEGLAAYLSRRAASRRHTRIHAFEERLDPAASDVNQPPEARWGSQALFAELRRQMLRQTDVVVYIHGFNVAWNEAVGSALALQEMLNLPAPGAEPQGVLVVLFTWPSDGRALPFVSYKSDRSEAAASGKAVGRGFLKLRDYLARLRAEARRGGAGPCDRSLHLLCHSMGN
ncbi:MAG: alpha/beta hydrolase, partial [Nitrospirae bacterium]